MRKHGKRCSMRDYAAMLQSISGEPMTAAQIGEDIGMSKVSVRGILAVLVKYGLAKKAGVLAIKSSRAQLYQLSDGTQTDETIKTNAARPNAIGFCLIAKAMMGGATVAEITEYAGVSKTTTELAVRELFSFGLIHVSGWVSSPSGPPSRVISFGRGRNAPRPKPLTMSERNRNYAQRRKERERVQLAYAGIGAGVMPKWVGYEPA